MNRSDRLERPVMSRILCFGALIFFGSAALANANCRSIFEAPKASESALFGMSTIDPNVLEKVPTISVGEDVQPGSLSQLEARARQVGAKGVAGVIGRGTRLRVTTELPNENLAMLKRGLHLGLDFKSAMAQTPLRLSMAKFGYRLREGASGRHPTSGTIHVKYYWPKEDEPSSAESLLNAAELRMVKIRALSNKTHQLKLLQTDRLSRRFVAEFSNQGYGRAGDQPVVILGRYRKDRVLMAQYSAPGEGGPLGARLRALTSAATVNQHSLRVFYGERFDQQEIYEAVQSIHGGGSEVARSFAGETQGLLDRAGENLDFYDLRGLVRTGEPSITTFDDVYVRQWSRLPRYVFAHVDIVLYPTPETPLLTLVEEVISTVESTLRRNGE